MKTASLALVLGAVMSVAACGSSTSPTKLKAVGPLSTVFQGKCASCHGDNGEGDIGPALKGVSLEAFEAAVREGRSGMPSYTAAVYSDADLQKDRDSLNK